MIPLFLGGAPLGVMGFQGHGIVLNTKMQALRAKASDDAGTRSALRQRSEVETRVFLIFFERQVEGVDSPASKQSAGTNFRRKIMFGNERVIGLPLHSPGGSAFEGSEHHAPALSIGDDGDAAFQRKILRNGLERVDGDK